MNWYKLSQEVLTNPTPNARWIEQIRRENPSVIVDPAPGANVSTALSPETAVIISSYPYGRLRCIMRYWRDRSKKGTRWMSQTNNPKVTELFWNNPGKSTYNNEGIMVLYVAPDRHVQRADLTINSLYESAAPEGHRYDTAEQKINDFLTQYGENVDEIDKATLQKMLSAIQRYQQKQQAILTPVVPATLPPTTP